MQKFDICTFGSITLDIFIPVPMDQEVKIKNQDDTAFFEVPLGEKIQVEESFTLCGGGAANSATGFSKLGLKTAIHGVMGDKSNRGFLISELEAQEVDTAGIIFAKNQASSFSVILHAPDGKRTVFHKRTSDERFNAEVLKNAPQAKALYIGHLYPGADGILHQLPERKQQYGEIIGWNPGKSQFQKGFEAFVDVFPSIDVLILNVEEAEAFTGLKARKIKPAEATPEVIGTPLSIGVALDVPYLHDVRSLAQKFMEAGVQTVTITDGARGAQIFESDQHLYTPAQDTPKIDTLGAGDAFSVGLMGAKVHGKSLLEQIAWANANSNAVVQKFGAQSGQLHLTQIQEIVNQECADLISG